MLKPLLALLVVVCTASGLPAQLRVEVTDVPAYTPTEDTLFLTGSFNDWDPRDRRFALRPAPGGRYAYEFQTPMPDFTFKLTRGGWERVEGGPRGEAIDNRRYVHNAAARDTLYLSVAGWEDLTAYLPALDTLRLVVTAVPTNTPPDASLYVTGSFNGWSPRVATYRLRRQDDGTFTARVPLRDSVTEYKITRGSFAAIESRRNGLALPNRRYVLPAGAPAGEPVGVRVANWEDLAGSTFGPYSLALLLTALQLLVLLAVVASFRARNPGANRWLVALLVLLATTLAARVAGFDRAVFQAFPKVILIPDLLYFLVGPLCWSYYRALRGGRPARRWLHFVPFGLAVVAYAPLWLATDYGLTHRIVTDSYRDFLSAAAAAGALHALVYWLLLLRARTQVQGEVDKSKGGGWIRFLQTGFWVLTLPLGCWLLAVGVGAYGRLTGRATAPLTDGLIDAAWLSLAPTVYVVAYFVVRQPRLFRRPVAAAAVQLPVTAEPTPPPVTVEPPPPPPEVPPGSEPAVDSADGYAQLTTLMATERPYRNPGLTLADLAGRAGLPTYLLSRLINERAGTNFFDYVNGYRIEDFKRRMRAGAGERKTILAVALEVGFNSKSAFNRAFKKREGTSPRRWLLGEGGAD